MKVELAQVLAQGGLKVKTGAGTFTASLKEGDSIKAQVISAANNSIVIKADGGQTFRARLDSDAMLLPGDNIFLEVTAKEEGIITLSIREETADGETAGQPELVRGFEDKTLLPYASKLAELKMPVTEESARLMSELITNNPGMTLDEAAFIASNKLAGDESLIQAAISILSDGDKADAMIERLLALLIQSTEDGVSGDAQGSAARGQMSGDGGNISQNVAQDAQQASVSEWLSLLESGDAEAAGTSLRGQLPSEASMQEIIPQSNSNMQSTILENNVEMMKNNISTGDLHASELQNSAILQTGGAIGAEGTEAGGRPEMPDAAADIHTVPDGTGDSGVAGTAGEQTSSVNNSEQGVQSTEFTGRAIAELLSELQEFRGTPAPALERFSNMLLRVWGESAGEASGDMEKLANILDKMFTRIEKNDKDAGARLKGAKEELFARLALLEEAITRAEPPARTQMLEQTRRLMDHVRLLNNIDQFVYLQLPVQIGEERKTAELYLFKKKGGKRVDPENVNILLALDLENMGHWEGLINFKSKDVSVRMEVAGPKEKAHFSENTVLLHELLSEAGFKLVSTDITHSKQETTPLTALSVFDKLTTRAGIDFKV